VPGDLDLYALARAVGGERGRALIALEDAAQDELAIMDATLPASRWPGEDLEPLPDEELGVSHAG
jgi:hypothetical protein